MKRRDALRSIVTSVRLIVSLPKISKAKEMIFKNSSCKKHGKPKALVIYASEYGSTEGVARVIAKVLCDDGKDVELMRVQDVMSLDGYEHVIVGSPIQYDTWMDEAKEFVNKYEKQLSLIKVDYFFTCLTLSQKTEKTIQQAQQYADGLMQINMHVVPRYIGQFAGVLDYNKFSFSFRILAHIMFAVLGVKEGDYRDWSAIKKWSNKIKG